MIQVLTIDGRSDEFKGENVKINSLHEPQSPDDFNINVIYLGDKKIWVNNDNNRDTIKMDSDIRSLAIMINHSKKAKIVIILPQNLNYTYNMGKEQNYWNYCELKDMIHEFTNILIRMHLPTTMGIVYERTKTGIYGGSKIDASFSLLVPSNAAIKTLSIKSEKATTIECNNVILTTLDINKHEDLMSFLKTIGLIQERENIPEWMEEIHMFDDEKQLQIIDENNNTIKTAQENISEAVGIINKNNEYKSILYTNGEKLVNVVFEILEKMLGCDLSEFEDEKKEDFLFEIGGLTFIGEIKGVNHNVKSQNVSQLDVHYQGYLEENSEKPEEQVKAILIINHQKNRSLADREPVHEKQISLANRNGSLIVETDTLLKMFEKRLNEEWDREKCIELLKNNKGLLKIDD